MGYVAHAESIPMPAGVIDPNVLRLIMHALRNEVGVTLTYQSFSEANPAARIIWPHVLVHTGERWHGHNRGGGAQGDTGGVALASTQN